MYSEFLQVNYAKAGDLAALIDGTSGGNSMLSERGSLGVDARTNTLLVQDTAERLQDVRRMVRTLDVPIKQVLIESRIVVVNDNFSRDLGVRLGLSAFNESNTGLTTISGTGSGTDTMISSYLDGLQNPGPGTPLLQYPDLSNRYNVNVPIAEAAGRFSLAVLENDYLVDLELTALEAEGAATIEAYSVMHDRDGTAEKVRAAVLLADGRRAWATSDNTQLGQEMCENEWVGKTVTLDATGDISA